MKNPSLRKSAIALIALAGLSCQVYAQQAQEKPVEPPAALVLDGVPQVPASVAAQVAKYTDFRPTGFTGWHPTKLEMLVVRRHKNTVQVHRLDKPGGKLELVTDFAEPVRGAAYEPKNGSYYIFGRDTGGNEVARVYRNTIGGKEPVAVSAEGRRASGGAWNNAGDRILWTTVPVGRTGSADKIKTELRIGDPMKPDESKVLGEFDGGGWGGFGFSPDDKQIVYIEYVSANESYVWLMDLATGKAKRITEKNGGEQVRYGETKFTRDGKGLYTLTDRDSEFTRLTHIDLATMKHTPLTDSIKWDVDDIDLSDDGKLLAFTTNEDGTNVLHVMTTADHKEVAMPKLPLGTLGGLKWHKDSTNLAFSVTSAVSPAEVYSVNMKSKEVTRWTQHEPMEVNPATFVEPELVRWKSFDGRMISGFLYRAPAKKFPGKRPVLIGIHGGPEGQFQPGFRGRDNYYLNELGISLIYPNVRGSSGYGKSFLKLDNGRLREDSVKDIGALFDWIGTQSDLDASRVAVTGGSYGGYMVLAVSTLYADRIAAAIDIVGISNFVSFLERTESYRRDLRRVEYGDERDPEMRKFLETISPLNRADRIKKPLFVIQGKNDPRVPVHEADQIVATVKKGSTPVSYMLANDEGHGFQKKANSDYQFYATIGFLKKYLLKEGS
jgi:dipeptidyl aminopeptidase/acylaminoacyl peptidase